ncbi:MAG: CoB--CoM heterodisulfide reductase iron-sulfur subunit B family protein [Candidatus Thorarchaeota archaeon]
MKEFMLYTGCTVPVRHPAYEASVKIVLEKLGIRVVDMDNVNCCGAQYLESINRQAFAAMSGRIIAMAEQAGLDILAICGACSGSLKMVKEMLDRDRILRAEVNDILAEEGLEYTGTSEVKHLLQVFHEDIGYDALREAIVRPYPKRLRLAAHYGCHVTRPYEIVHVDDPENPTIIDRIIELAGATPVNYVGKTKCCGGPMLAMDPSLAAKIGMEKIQNVRNERADGIVTACVFCDIQLTQVQFEEGFDPKDRVPVLTLPQFLGPALGVDKNALGAYLNKISPDRVFESLQEVV